MKLSGIRSIATVAALTGMALVSMAANAVPVTTWTDVKSPHAYVAEGATFSYTHSIVPDFTPGFDTVTSFDLAIDLYDDSLFGIPEFWENESASIKLAGTFSGTSESGWWTLFTLPDYVVNGSVVASALAQLNKFGELTVTVSSVFGDFIVGNSVLKAYGTEGTASVPVPEPGTLGMLGLGLLGVAFVARRRKNN